MTAALARSQTDSDPSYDSDWNDQRSILAIRLALNRHLSSSCLHN